MFAVVGHVDIAEGGSDEAEAGLHAQVIPSSKASAGFVRGTWMQSSDKRSGVAVMLFETEEQASAMAAEMQQASPPPDMPVIMRQVEVMRIVGEA